MNIQVRGVGLLSHDMARRSVHATHPFPVLAFGHILAFDDAWYAAHLLSNTGGCNSVYNGRPAEEGGPQKIGAADVERHQSNAGKRWRTEENATRTGGHGALDRSRNRGCG